MGRRDTSILGFLDIEPTNMTCVYMTSETSVGKQIQFDLKGNLAGVDGTVY
jgi:hypothetical protein